MNLILKSEEAAMAILSFILMYSLDLSFYWWLYPILFLVPDISAIGYLINNKVGAIAYNFAHFKGLAIALWIAGILSKNVYLEFAGLMLFFHSSIDRALGFGLKYEDGFKHTHMGMMK